MHRNVQVLGESFLYIALGSSHQKFFERSNIPHTNILYLLYAVVLGIPGIATMMMKVNDICFWASDCEQYGAFPISIPEGDHLLLDKLPTALQALSALAFITQEHSVGGVLLVDSMILILLYSSLDW